MLHIIGKGLNSITLAVRKLRDLLHYCRLNCIIPQYSKCQFIVINGEDDDKEPLPLGEKFLKIAPHLELLGSHLSATGLLAEDLKLHMKERYKACIKYYNFLRENRLAPLIVKIKVLRACVVNSLLTNCEAFGNCIPKDLEKTYAKLLRCAFNVRTNTPILNLFIESGFIPIRALIIARQLNWFTRYKEGLIGNTPRVQLFGRLMNEPTNYIKHYIDICERYSSVKEVYSEAAEGVKSRVREFAENGRYKYRIYTEMNPDLQKSPFINNPNPISGDVIRFRVGSHLLPIETGRWTRTLRENRLCTACGVLGDERHAIYQCGEVDRTGLHLRQPLSSLWNSDNVLSLFRNLKVAKLL